MAIDPATAKLLAQMALKLATDEEARKKLLIIILPSTLLEPWFLSWWNMHSTIVSSVVLEISESEPIGDWKTLKTIINKLRDRGVKIALDDMGTGYSFFQHWVELNLDYIKLDRDIPEMVSICTRAQFSFTLIDLFIASKELLQAHRGIQEDQEEFFLSQAVRLCMQPNHRD